MENKKNKTKQQQRVITPYNILNLFGPFLGVSGTWR